MTDILNMYGVKPLGYVQMCNRNEIILSTICIVIFVILTGISCFIFERGNVIGLLGVIVFTSFFVFSLIALFISLEKHTYIKLMVLDESEAGLQIIEKYDDLIIDGSTFYIQLDEQGADDDASH